MSQSVLIALVVLVGAVIPLQPGINAEAARHLGHPLWAACVNFAVGLAALLACAGAARLAPPSSAALQQAPWWAWLGGLCGASLVFTGVVAAPRLGAALLVAGLVAGQLCSSVLIDHFGLAGFIHRPLSVFRIAGVLLLGLGVAMIRYES